MSDPKYPDFMESTAIFMTDCDEILDEISNQSGIPDSGRKETKDSLIFKVEKQRDQASNFLSLVQDYGLPLITCLKRLPKEQLDIFCDTIDRVNENVMSTAFFYALQKHLSANQRIMAIRFGIENILAYTETNQEHEFAPHSEETPIQEIIASLPAATHEEKEKEANDLPPFLDVFEKCGGVIFLCLNRLPDSDQDKFFDLSAEMDEKTITHLFKEVMNENLNDRQKIPFAEVAIETVLASAKP